MTTNANAFHHTNEIYMADVNKNNIANKTNNKIQEEIVYV